MFPNLAGYIQHVANGEKNDVHLGRSLLYEFPLSQIRWYHIDTWFKFHQKRNNTNDTVIIINVRKVGQRKRK